MMVAIVQVVITVVVSGGGPVIAGNGVGVGFSGCGTMRLKWWLEVIFVEVWRSILWWFL